jgi:hypothetical protein
VNKIDLLLRASVNKKLNPITDLPWGTAPEKNKFWMTESMISIYGEPEYEALTIKEKIKLSQLEFCLVCSISSSGEKEVIANMVTRMLKSNYKDFRRYFYHFIEEENNHIYMFSEFCDLYGEFFPVLYSYAQGNVWERPETGDLLTFCHVLIFEELGQGLNEVMSEDESLPELVRAINKYHVQDEGRHISFGRALVSEFAGKYRGLVSDGEWEKLKVHVGEYLSTRHYDYHNVKIYKSIGIKNALSLRNRMIEKRDEAHFIKSNMAKIRIESLINFLKSLDLISNDYVSKSNLKISLTEEECGL